MPRLIIRWGLMPFCWFCRALAQLLSSNHWIGSIILEETQERYGMCVDRTLLKKLHSIRNPQGAVISNSSLIAHATTRTQFGYGHWGPCFLLLNPMSTVKCQQTANTMVRRSSCRLVLVSVFQAWNNHPIFMFSWVTLTGLKAINRIWAATSVKRTFENVRPAKIQISLRICAIWSESSLAAVWVANDAKCRHAENEDSDQTGRMRRLSWVSIRRTWQKFRFLTLRPIFSYNFLQMWHDVFFIWEHYLFPD